MSEVLERMAQALLAAKAVLHEAQERIDKAVAEFRAYQQGYVKRAGLSLKEE